jgi:hypothetical protein
VQLKTFGAVGETTSVTERIRRCLNGGQLLVNGNEWWRILFTTSGPAKFLRCDQGETKTYYFLWTTIGEIRLLTVLRMTVSCIKLCVSNLSSLISFKASLEPVYRNNNAYAVLQNTTLL